MLTIDYDRLGEWVGRRVLDLGCGQGRHSFEALRRGAQVVSLDLDHASLTEIAVMGAAMQDEGMVPRRASLEVVRADGLGLPFADNSFDVVIASEVLEHVPEDTDVLEEIKRVLRPEATLALSVPRRWPEAVCWMLSEHYHAKPGGHVRIYSSSEVRQKLKRVGLRELGSHHAHALHAPYWWLKCALNGKEESDEDGWATRAYHNVLVWDMTQPKSPLQPIERALNPLMGKSFVLYARKERAAT